MPDEPATPPPAVPVIPLDYAEQDRRNPGWPYQTARWLGLGTVIVCWSSTALIQFVDVETVLVTGPLLATVAVAQMVFAWPSRLRALTAVGLGHLLICILFFGLVQLLRWGPRQAHQPFLVMGLMWSTAATALTFLFGLARARLAATI